jgi:hypothetical protein
MPSRAALAEPTPRAWAKRHCASGSSVVSAQEALKLIFLFSDLFNSLQIQKFV